MKCTYLNYLLSFFLLILFGACKDEASTVDIDGVLLNRINGSAISGLEVNLSQIAFNNGGVIQTTTSDSTGNFHFKEERSRASGRHIDLPNYQTDYQEDVWLNGDLVPSFWVLGASIDKYGVLQNGLTIELYPHCSFEISINNTAPMAETDMVKFTLRNTGCTEPQSEDLNGGVREILFKGFQENTIISGRTAMENILTIEYEVTTDSVSESFLETVECTPGELTQIEINY